MDAEAILTPPCAFCGGGTTENHHRNIQGGVRMALTPTRLGTEERAAPLALHANEACSGRMGKRPPLAGGDPRP